MEKKNGNQNSVSYSVKSKIHEAGSVFAHFVFL